MLTFLIRDFPDLDHFAPIIFKYVIENPNKKILIIEFNADIDLENDYRIIYLNKISKNILIKNAYTVLSDSLIRKFLSVLFSKKNKNINFNSLKKRKKRSLFDFILHFLISILKTVLLKKNNFYEKFFFSKEWSRKLIKTFNISTLVMDDSFFLSFNKNKNLVHILKNHNKKVVLLPHTCHIFDFAEEKEIFSKINFSNFYPDLIVCNEKRRNNMISFGYNPTKVKNFGSARFSNEWINIHSKIVNSVKTNSSKKKLNIVVIDGTYNHHKRQSTLLNKLSHNIPNIEIVFRTHVRKNNKIEDIRSLLKLNNKILIDFNTPTTNLIKNADIVIGTMSSILIEAFIFEKFLIFPTFLLNENNVKVYYKSRGFSFDCENEEEVLNKIILFDEYKKRINSKSRSDFIEEFVYGAKDQKLILKNYSDYLLSTQI